MRRWRWMAAWGAAVLVSAGCGSVLSDQELIRANGQGFETSEQAASPEGAAPANGLEGTTDATATPEAVDAGAAPAATAANATGRATGNSAVPGSASSSRGAAGPPAAAGGQAGARAASPSQAAAGGRGPSTGGPATGPSGAPIPGMAATPGAPIKLGQIATRTGPVGAALQSGLDATRAWVADVNARGGLAGHPVELVATDDRGDPNQALALARQLVEKDGVLALYASLQVTTLQAILPYVEQKGIPIIGSCACGGAQFGDASPMLFDVGATSGKGLVWEHLAAMTLTDKKKVGILYCREAASCAFMHDGIVAYQKQLGFQVVYEAQVSLAQPDFTAEVLQAQQRGVEVLVTNVDNASTTRIARAAHRQNYYPGVIAPHSYAEDKTLRDAGKDSEGILTATGVAEWSNAPIMADYREAMNRYVPGGVRGGPGTNVWVAGIMLERLAREWPAQSTTADVLKSLYALRNETLGGRIPPTAYRQGTGHGDTAVCAVPVKVVEGKFTTPNGAQNFVCAPGWQPVQP